MATKHKWMDFEFDLEEFALAIDGVMIAENIADEELAELVGLDHSTINNYRNGNIKDWYPRMATFLNICNVLNIDPRNYFKLVDI
jgi:transcriptional regulator with XRE-family HTH domain